MKRSSSASTAPGDGPSAFHSPRARPRRLSNRPVPAGAPRSQGFRAGPTRRVIARWPPTVPHLATAAGETSKVAVGAGAGCRTRSMSSSVLALHFLGDPSTLTDLEALRPSPVADVSTALPGAGCPAGYRMPGHLPGIGDEYLRHLVKAPVVFGTQVNLQSAAVESDRPRLRVLCATADVARHCHSGLRCHPCPPIRCGRLSAHWPRRIHVQLVSAAQGWPFSFRRRLDGRLRDGTFGVRTRWSSQIGPSPALLPGLVVPGKYLESV